MAATGVAKTTKIAEAINAVRRNRLRKLDAPKPLSLHKPNIVRRLDSALRDLRLDDYQSRGAMISIQRLTCSVSDYHMRPPQDDLEATERLQLFEARVRASRY